MSRWYAPEYNTQTFSQIWSSYDSFKADYDAYMPLLAASGDEMTEESIQTTYYLLYATFGNNPIINMDIFQWKMKLLKIIFIYGPEWQLKMTIQNTIRNLSEDDLLQGSRMIYNHAFNDSATPDTTTTEQLTYINDQNTSNNKKGPLEAQMILWNNLRSDETEAYIKKFNPCFSQFLRKYFTVDFITGGDE